VLKIDDLVSRAEPFFPLVFQLTLPCLKYQAPRRTISRTFSLGRN
jgi:hypothetical protein